MTSQPASDERLTIREALKEMGWTGVLCFIIVVGGLILMNAPLLMGTLVTLFYTLVTVYAFTRPKRKRPQQEQVRRSEAPDTKQVLSVLHTLITDVNTIAADAEAVTGRALLAAIQKAMNSLPPDE